MRKVTSSFQIIDRGWDNIIHNLREAGNSFTKVGFPSGGKTEGRHNMEEQIEIAVTHEFGSSDGKIPERSFMRSSFDESREKISLLQKEAIAAVVSGAKTVRQALFGIGEEAKSIVKQKLLDGPFTPLSPKTIAKKGHDIPLFETGQLRDTVQHEEVIYGAKA